MNNPTMPDGNPPFDGATFWTGDANTWIPLDAPPPSDSSTSGGGGSKGSKGGVIKDVELPKCPCELVIEKDRSIGLSLVD